MTADPPPLLKQRRQERQAFPEFSRDGVNGWKIVIVAVVVGLALTAFFFWRAHSQTAADATLCRKIDRGTVALIRFVESLPVPPKGSKARLERRRFLAGERQALCDPKNLATSRR
jgi:hypothetical protein